MALMYCSPVPGEPSVTWRQYGGNIDQADGEVGRSSYDGLGGQLLMTFRPLHLLSWHPFIYKTAFVFIHILQTTQGHPFLKALDLPVPRTTTNHGH